MKASSVTIRRYEFVAFPTGERWDRPLTEEEYERLNASERKARSYTALVRKVAMVQLAAENPESFPTDVAIPKNRKGLREWSDPSRGLWIWNYIKLDNPNGVNSDEIAAFFQALSDISELKKGNQSKLRRQLVEKKAIIERLEMRNIQLLQRIGKLQDLMAKAGMQNDDV